MLPKVYGRGLRHQLDSLLSAMDEEDDSYSYSDESEVSSVYSSSPEEAEGARYYVTKESRENVTEASRKESYAGMRDLTDLEKIQEEDIVGADGSIRGVKNRVRAGMANFQNREALEKVCRKRGWGWLVQRYYVIDCCFFITEKIGRRENNCVPHHLQGSKEHL